MFSIQGVLQVNIETGMFPEAKVGVWADVSRWRS